MTPLALDHAVSIDFSPEMVVKNFHIVGLTSKRTFTAAYFVTTCLTHRSPTAINGAKFVDGGKVEADLTSEVLLCHRRGSKLHN